MSKNSFLLFTLLLWLGPFDCAQSETYPVIICDMNYRVNIHPIGLDTPYPTTREIYHHCGSKSETLDGCRFKGKIALEFVKNNELVKIYNSGTHLTIPIYDVNYHYYDLGYSDIIVSMNYSSEAPSPYYSGGTIEEFRTFILNKHLNTINGIEATTRHIDVNINRVVKSAKVHLTSIGECKGEMHKITRR